MGHTVSRVSWRHKKNCDWDVASIKGWQMSSVKGQIVNVQALEALCNTTPAGEWKEPWTTQQHVQVFVPEYGRYW